MNIRKGTQRATHSASTAIHQCALRVGTSVVMALGFIMPFTFGNHAAIAAPASFLPATQGWVSWDVPATEDAPAWCCFGNDDARTTGASHCDLDAQPNGFGSRNRERTDTLRLYAKLEGGRIERLRALAPTCEVRSASPVQALGPQSGAASAMVLGERLLQLPPGDEAQTGKARMLTRELYQNILAGLALHRDNKALDWLAQAARSERSREQRKPAVFWIGQRRGEESIAVLKPILLGDGDEAIREHAAFAVSQSRSPQAVGLLIQQGESDSSIKVRSQAWFWLGQTKSAEVERAILAAIQKEPERRVRHQAVFALSQLPAERAVRALAGVAENRALDRDDRKQALFWLGQSKSPEAMEYLEKTLARAVP